MAPPSQLDRLAGHTSHLVDWLIEAHQKYAMVRPMLFDTGMTGHLSTGLRTQGFLVVRNALFQGCIQDVVGAAIDGNEQTPSVKKICTGLADERLRKRLRQQHAVWVMKREPNENPDIAAALSRMESREAEKRGEEFDQGYKALHSEWSELEANPVLPRLKEFRDKLVAHRDIHYDGKEYVLMSVGSLGLTWGDLGKTLDRLTTVVTHLNYVVRQAHFDFVELRTRLDSDSAAFLSPELGSS